MSPIILLALKMSVAMIGLGVGLESMPRDITYLMRHPGLLARTILSMYVVMPLVAISLCVMFELHPAIRVALLALAISPVPPFLLPKADKAGGDGSYMIGLLTVTAVLTLVVVPAWLWLLGHLFSLPVDVPLALVVKIVASTLIAPLLIGIGIGHVAPVTHRAGRVSVMCAMLVLVVAVVPVVMSSWSAFRVLAANGTLVAIVALTIAGLISGHALGGPARENRTVLALATPSRHPVVAIVIATANSPGAPLVVPAILLALVVSAIAAVPYVALSKRAARSSSPG